jgi:hypothetical protein
MRSDRGERSYKACASLCERREKGSVRDQMPMHSWLPVLALIWGARSRDPVQVGYRWMQTLTSLGLLGLLGLQVSILFLDCSRYANSEDPRGRTLVSKNNHVN